MNKRIILSALTMLVVLAGVSGATVAAFSDTETSTGNTFTAGTLNLQVGDEDPTTWGFTESNLAPGSNANHDVGVVNTGTVDGDLSLIFAVNNSDEGDNPEAEGDTDNANGGELDDQVHVIVYMREDAGDDFNNIGLVINDFAVNLDGNTYDIPAAYDAWVNDETTDTAIRFRTQFKDDAGQAFDNNDAMGDSFDLDITFNLDQ